MSSLTLKVKKLSKDATIPRYGSEGAAGLDLYSVEETTVAARGRALVKTDIAIQIPEGHYGRVAPRSGLAVKQGINIGAGVIDSDYRGNLGIVLFNNSDEAFSVEKGDRIAQLILEKYSCASVEEVDELDKSERGGGGFGSTGMK